MKGTSVTRLLHSFGILLIGTCLSACGLISDFDPPNETNPSDGSVMDTGTADSSTEDGSLPFDAGEPDAGCPTGLTPCGDACVNLNDAIEHCGRCDNACGFEGAAAACMDGVCTLGMCDPNRGNCNGSETDGCEVDTLMDTMHCGACGTTCTLDNATPVCTSGSCVIETCNTGFGDCNTTISDGCEIDTQTNIAHCGACGTTCALANATPACRSGSCAIDACNTGFDDCNAAVADGCEINTQIDVAHCGACGTTCSLTNATPACTSGSCAIDACNAGFGDCNTAVADGCEINTQTNVMHCGACGTTCTLTNATPACRSGSCEIDACFVGHADCNGVTADGCEVNMKTDVAHCGSCGNACVLAHATAGCDAASCHIASCDTGYENCNTAVSDGCEINIETDVAHCGTCGSACSFANAVPACRMGSCAIDACDATFGNCNGAESDGCETALLTDLAHCGACGSACTAVSNTTKACEWGVCVVASCATGFADLNGAVPDGCETALPEPPRILNAGGDTTCRVRATGEIECWGDNAHGQLGDGTTVDSNVPVTVSGITNATSVTTSGGHTCAILVTGAVKCWGHNVFGAVGNGTTVDQTTPVAVPGITTATELALGRYHSCARLADGQVQCWGYNEQGQLGRGTFSVKQLSPGAVTSLNNAARISAGLYHTCALLMDGEVACWGKNFHGQLGDGTDTNRSTPTQIPGLTEVVAVAAGGHHTCAQRAAGSVECWGKNEEGQLGDGTNTPRLSPVSVSGISSVAHLIGGEFHACAILSTGAVQCWGSNGYGQLGNGTLTGSNTPVTVSGLSDATNIAAGRWHSCAIDTRGAVYCWGRNDTGQLGDGSSSDSATPVISGGGGAAPTPPTISLGGDHSCALRSSGIVECWGNNSYGQLGDGTLISRTTPVSVSALVAPLSVATGQYHSCAVVSTGQVQCWGLNTFGQLGDGTTTNRSSPVTVSGITNAIRVVAHEAHTCALLSSDIIQCWGSNATGQLGNGALSSSSTPVTVSGITNASSVATGGSHSCAVLTSGQVRCWGANAYGQLGDGTTSSRSTPVAVGTLSDVVDIVAGLNHTCALRTGGLVDCWGSNADGNLGTYSSDICSVGGSTVSCSQTPVSLSITDPVAVLSARMGHTCAALTGGQVRCWGTNNNGQIGDGSTTHRGVPTTVIAGVGGSALSDVEQVSVGAQHTCATLNSSHIQCWGDNFFGQIGDGTSADRLFPVNVSGFP